jgi:hypothetical protein
MRLIMFFKYFLVVKDYLRVSFLIHKKSENLKENKY